MLSLVEFFFSDGGSALAALRVLRYLRLLRALFRTLRLMRMFKVVHAVREMSLLLHAVSESLFDMLTLILLIVLLGFIFAMIGLQLFSGRPVVPGSFRLRFDDVGQAFVAVFQVSFFVFPRLIFPGFRSILNFLFLLFDSFIFVVFPCVTDYHWRTMASCLLLGVERERLCTRSAVFPSAAGDGKIPASVSAHRCAAGSLARGAAWLARSRSQG